MPGQPSETTSSDTLEGLRSASLRRAADRPRVGLVLGGGGLLGGAWLVGALHAVAERTGWDPSTSDYIIGTSAGSVIAAFTAAGIPTWFLVHHQRGGDMSGIVNDEGDPIRDADETSAGLMEWSGSVPRPFLGSPGLALRTALQPWRYTPTAAMSAWLGRGFLSTHEIGRMVRTVTGEGWPDHPNLWIVAVDYATGRRTVFGTPSAPKTPLWHAVEASCAIPGLYRPPRIAGRLYIDGGAWSPSNADLLAPTDVEVVVVLNPMSSLDPGLPSGIAGRLAGRIRRSTGRRLGREARRLREVGKEVLLIQPRSFDIEAMGVNLMDPSRRADVLEIALKTVRARLDDEDAVTVLRRLGSAQ